MNAQRTVVVLGSTGSIGTQALQVVDQHPGRFRVTALASGGRDLPLLAAQALAHGVEAVAVADAPADAVHAALRDAAAGTGRGTDGLPDVLTGPDAAEHLAGSGADVVLNGITGSIGLRPTIAALRVGSTLALANKESLIVGGPLVTALAEPGQIVPVDSEHSAIAQCLRAGEQREVRRLVLTASGGPFRGRTRAELGGVTPEEALAHPTWDMGRVVTTNSATLVNKGLEVIEAHLLFDIPFEAIEVAVHPQSVVHSMVEFHDGSTLLQASPPTMLIPIALGLAWPERLGDVAPACDWTRAATWEFHPLDDVAFPSVRLAREAGAAGGTLPAVYNAANEEAVDAFHDGRVGFLGIVDTVQRVLDDATSGNADAAPDVHALTIEDVLHAETWARERARAVLADLTPGVPRR